MVGVFAVQGKKATNCFIGFAGSVPSKVVEVLRRTVCSFLNYCVKGHLPGWIVKKVFTECLWFGKWQSFMGVAFGH